MKALLRISSQDALALSLLLLPILAVAYLLPIYPNDTGWFLRLGGEIARTGAIPTIEFMSYTQAGQPAVYQHWLAAVVLWGAEQSGGAALTLWLRGLLLGLFYTFTWLMCREAGAGRWSAALVTFLAALAGSGNWAVRPQMFAYPLFAWTAWQLWRWHLGRPAALWGLPVAALLWINLHHSTVLLFALAAAALAAGGGQRRQLLLWLAAALLATFVNPRGALVWADTLAVVSHPSNRLYSLEWKPPINTGWQMNLFFAWLLLSAPLAWVTQSRPRPLAWLWFAGLGWLALSGVRYVIWFTMVLAFTSAGMLRALPVRLPLRPPRFEKTALNWALALLLLLLPLPLLPGARAAWWPAAPPVYSNTTPLQAAAWLKAHPDLPGPLWADLEYSSYLVYALPERPVWVYTRIEQFSPEHWQRYNLIAAAEPGWQEALEGEGIRLLILSKAKQPRLAQAAVSEEGWQAAYEDDQALVLTRP